MPTMMELLGNDFGVEENVKTAAVQDDSELDQIAASLGFGKFAEDEEKEEEQEEEKEEEKKASAEGYSLFGEIFPEDEVLSNTAEELEKVAY